MSERYVRLYAMKQVVAYKGTTKPDDPVAPGGGSGPPVPPVSSEDSFFPVTSPVDPPKEILPQEKIESEGDSFFKDQYDTIDPASLEVGQTVTGWVGLGVLVQSCLYQDSQLRRYIRMYDIQKGKSLFPGGTMFALNNLRDGLSLAGFRLAQLTLVAASDSSTYPLYGKSHTTTMVVSTLANVEELAKYLKDAVISIGEKNVKYKVKPGTFVFKSVKTVAEEVA